MGVGGPTFCKRARGPNYSGAGECSATTDFTPRRHAAAPILEYATREESSTGTLRSPCLEL